MSAYTTVENLAFKKYNPSVVAGFILSETQIFLYKSKIIQNVQKFNTGAGSLPQLFQWSCLLPGPFCSRARRIIFFSVHTCVSFVYW